MSGPIQPGQWPFSIRLLFFVVLLVFGVGIIWFIRPVWWLIALAGIVGYLLQPTISYMTRARIPRSLATVISLLLLLLIVSLLPAVLVPALIADIAPISIDFGGILDSLIRWVQQLPQTFPGFTFLSYQVDLTPFYREV
ncbi:MAG: AI-2E family transporter, partial [Caldilineae bacterium]